MAESANPDLFPDPPDAPAGATISALSVTATTTPADQGALVVWTIDGAESGHSIDPNVTADQVTLDAIPDAAGSTARVVLDDRGLFVPDTFEAQGEHAELLTKLLAPSLALALPSEPVGVGGEWRVETSRWMQERGLSPTLSVVVVDIDGHVVKLEADSWEVNDASAPPEGSSVLVDTAHLVSIDASLDLHRRNALIASGMVGTIRSTYNEGPDRQSPDSRDLVDAVWSVSNQQFVSEPLFGCGEP